MMKAMLRRTFFLLMIVVLSMPACTPGHTTTVSCDVADLIEAIDDANADAVLDTLELDPGCIYILTEVNTTVTGAFEETTFDYGDVGLPPITTPITIKGQNATIHRAEEAPPFRIFHLLPGANLTLNDLILTNGHASRPGSGFPSSGGAIYNDDALLTVNRSTLQGNTAEAEGGAIFDIGIEATTYVKDSVIRDNTAPHGGGLFSYQGKSLTVEGSSILYNIAITEGGGINVGYGSELIVRASVISFNHSGRRGGGIFKDGGADRMPTTISSSTFEGNTADWGGGGVFIWRTPLSIGGSTFLQNRAGEYGGGLAYQNDSTETVLIRSTTFDGNVAELDGGAIHFSGQLMTLAYDTFRNNAAENGGAIHNAEAALPTYIQRADTTMVIERGTIQDNTASTHGGGVYNGGTLTVNQSVIAGNTSTSRGGGIHNLGVVTVQDSTFRSNTAGLDGGGLSTYRKAAVTGSTFQDNSAKRGGGLASVGGDTTLTNDTFSKNFASERGGGIFNMGPLLGDLSPGGEMDANHITVAYNRAPSGGGISVRSGVMKVKNSIVALSTSGGDCDIAGGSLSGVSENLDSDDSCPSFTLKDDPRLDNLGNNGGPTETHALRMDSPAINAAPDCTTIAGTALSVDQRAHPRPVGPFCDLGAYEYDQALPAPPTKTPTLTPTPVPPGLTAIQNANCRYGPGQAYDIADTLFAGQTALIVARNPENTWWQIQGPALGRLCWVSKVTVEVTGPTEGVPVVIAPPPPTLTPEPSPRGCWVYNRQKQKVCVFPCPENPQPGGACTP
ncbi:MAG: choice-of-anchor Q domain-containing protein [Anaerolineales bacterium]